MKDIIPFIVVLIIGIFGIYFMIKPSTNNNNEISKLKQELEEVKLQRDLLSDAIRSYNDQDDKEDISIMKTTQYFLEIEGYCIDDLNNWVYCY